MIKGYGIRWSVHPLFVIVMLASIATGYFAELMSLFAIVLVHELGHVLAAKSYGWNVREVKLLPFGGVAEVEEAGHVPAKEEIIVALCGPLQNVWMGGVAWLFGQWGLLPAGWAADLLHANIMIGLFNMLPILPLDGGRIAQALLGYKMPFHMTLVWCARISLLFSAVMIAYAFYPGTLANGVQLNALTVGCFLLLSNWTYLRNVPYVFLRFLTRRDRIAARLLWRGTVAQPIVVTGDHTVHKVLRLFMREKYHLIYVMESRGLVAAVLPEEKLVDSYLLDGKPGRAVTELFR
ncbi:Zn-dependent protease [Paenibacillaceae bacterium]|nr:Zn-dependent protease [Paenibacillaceae bacterium]